MLLAGCTDEESEQPQEQPEEAVDATAVLDGVAEIPPEDVAAAEQLAADRQRALQAGEPLRDVAEPAVPSPTAEAAAATLTGLFSGDVERTTDALHPNAGLSAEQVTSVAGQLAARQRPLIEVLDVVMVRDTAVVTAAVTFEEDPTEVDVYGLVNLDGVWVVEQLPEA